MPESLYRPPTQHRYSTPSGEMEPADVRARAVGNAVFLEHVGGCGDIFAWGARDKDAAEAITDELNAVLNGLRSALADAAGKAGHYAHEMRAKLEAVEETHADALALVRITLSQLDGLASVWGDEGVFRSCRDRLRSIPGVVQ